jgi:glycosyltransferase involved in cell wall biosynthesis
MAVGTALRIVSGRQAPSVSIVVPTYQNAPFIERTLESALGQTFEDIEICVSDHSSTDGTWSILQRYAADPRVTLERISSGGGAERNWNAVTARARGDFVKLLCGDDLLHADCVRRQVEALRANPSAVMAAVRRDLVDVYDRRLLRGRGLGSLRGLVPGHDAIRALVRSGTNLLGEPGCVLIRRQALEQVGGWSAAFPYLIDQCTYMRLLELGDLVAVDETLAAFRVSNAQWSVRLAAQQAAQARGAHRDVRSRLPHAVDRRDEWIGNVRALRTAWARRLAYVVWRIRSREA